tara:strand:+ start:1007 stop:1306 length:300 start_codon:yes stop_codon:yes gene_type:complete
MVDGDVFRGIENRAQFNPTLMLDHWAFEMSSIGGEAVTKDVLDCREFLGRFARALTMYAARKGCHQTLVDINQECQRTKDVRESRPPQSVWRGSNHEDY